jgi:hypothetical protein
MLLCNRPRPRTRPRPRSLIWNWFGSGSAAWRGVAYNAGGRQEAPLQRVEDEDELENEEDLVAATPR